MKTTDIFTSDELQKFLNQIYPNDIIRFVSNLLKSINVTYDNTISTFLLEDTKYSSPYLIRRFYLQMYSSNKEIYSKIKKLGDILIYVKD